MGPSVPNSAAAVIVTDVCPAHYNDIIHIQTLLLLLVLETNLREDLSFKITEEAHPRFFPWFETTSYIQYSAFTNKTLCIRTLVEGAFSLQFREG